MLWWVNMGSPLWWLGFQGNMWWNCSLMIESSENRRKEMVTDDTWKRLGRKPTPMVQPLVSTLYSNKGFSWYGTALHCTIGDHIGEWMHIRRSVTDLSQPYIEVFSNRVLSFWNLVHDPGFLQAILGTWSILRNWLQNVTKEGDTGGTEADVVKR